MDTMHLEFPPPPSGHNGPPAPPTPEQITAFLEDTHAGLTERRDQLLQAAEDFLQKFPVIENDDVQAAVTENIAMFVKAIRMAEDMRKIEKDPYLSGGRAVDAWFGALVASLQAPQKLLEMPAKAYALKLKAEREAAARERARAAALEAERAAQAAREAEEAQRPSADHLYASALAAGKKADLAETRAAGTPADFSRTIGTYGSTSALYEKWDVEILDPELVPPQFWTRSFDMVALRRAAAAPGAPEIPGCRTFPVFSLKTRS